MKLSEAIRKGAKERPKTLHALFSWQEGQLCSCALGAAYEAATGSTCYREDLVLIFPELLTRVQAPHKDKIMSLQDIIASLNDAEGLSREAIADWVESVGY